jgi:hypothetical protein
MGLDTVSQPGGQVIEGYVVPEYSPTSEDVVGHELVEDLRETAERELRMASIASDVRDVQSWRSTELKSSQREHPQAMTVTSPQQTSTFPLPKNIFTSSTS